MANKLPWFTHDHDARSDLFLQHLIDRFGHFGYAGYFMILELLHQHGNGDTLVISRSALAAQLRSKRAAVEQLLATCSSAGKMEVTMNSSTVEIRIKKFRERQSKLKSKIPQPNPQPSVNLPQEGEGEREREKDIAGKKGVLVLVDKKPKQPKERTPIQIIIGAFKLAKGIDRDDERWDKANFSRYAKAAKSLLEACGTVEMAVTFLVGKAGEWTEKGLTDWGLDAIAKHAWNSGAQITEALNDGHEHIPLDDSKPGQPRRLSGPPREGAGAMDALRSIEKAGQTVAGMAGQPGRPDDEAWAEPFLAEQDERY